jgi:hypothetical protein
MPDSLDFPVDELDEARRLNRQLRWAPRFRAPSRLGKLMIQTMLGAQALMPHGVPGVTTRTRRISWKGESFSIRILLPHRRGACLRRLPWRQVGHRHGRDGRPRQRPRIAGAGRRSSASTTPRFRHRLSRRDRPCASAGDWLPNTRNGIRVPQCSWWRIRRRSPCRLRLTPRTDPTSRLRGAVLFYGPYDLSCTLSVRAAPPDTLVLDGPAMTSGLANLLPDRTEEQRRDPAFSPLYANLSGLPPALLLCGTIDPLIDDSRLMAERWIAASGNAHLIVVPDAPHAFNRFPTRVASRTNAFVRTWISARLASAATTAQAAE